jgi:hypothetical protein
MLRLFMKMLCSCDFRFCGEARGCADLSIFPTG